MKKLRLLIADDHDEMRSHMVALLSRDYEVVGAVTNGEDLVQAANRLLPDVIVSDTSMPRMDGPTARNRLIAQGKRIPFVFVSCEGREIIKVLRKGSSVSFVYKREISRCLVNAVEAIYKEGEYYSPFYTNPFENSPEDRNIVLIEEETLCRAEQLILSCEACDPEAWIPFDQILNRLTGSDTAV